MNTSDIETILTHAPLPKAPAGLRDRLCAQAAKGGIRASNSHGSSTQTQAGWIRRWWPALAPAAVSLACATVFTFQQREIREFKEPLANSQETIHAAAQAESFKAASSSTA